MPFIVQKQNKLFTNMKKSDTFYAHPIFGDTH